MDGNLNYFYKNADADEVIFVHEGTGTLRTQYGRFLLIMAIISLSLVARFTKLISTTTTIACL
jgi:homogentisate 1,2-dioxygenase